MADGSNLEDVRMVAMLDEDWADRHVGESLAELEGSRRRQGHADGVPRLRSGCVDEWIPRECARVHMRAATAPGASGGMS